MLENLKENKCSFIDISLYKKRDYSEMLPKSILPETKSEWENVIELDELLEDQEGMDDMPEEIFNALLDVCLHKKQYRNAFLLVAHANWGMRYSDVSQIRLIQLINPRSHKLEFRSKISFGEQKTKKTRQFYINEAIQAATVLYLNHCPDKKCSDYMIISEGNRKGYEYVIDESTSENIKKKKALRVNGKYVYKKDENGNLIPKPLSRSQEEKIIKDTIINDLGIALKNDSRCFGGELKLNTHSLRKLYCEKFNEVAYDLKHRGILKIDSHIQTLVQWDLAHTSPQTTARYCRGFERAKEMICNNMNIGLSVLNRYIEEIKNELTDKKISPQYFDTEDLYIHLFQKFVNIDFKISIVNSDWNRRIKSVDIWRVTFFKGINQNSFICRINYPIFTYSCAFVQCQLFNVIL